MAGTAGTGTERRLFDGSLLLIALGALALAVSLFVDWYGAGFGGGTISAWTAFELVDIVLAGLALAALVAVAEHMLVPGAPRTPAWVSAVCGPVALAIVVVSIIDEPPAAGGAAATLEAGGWIALAGAGVMTIGALLSGLRISIVVGTRDAGGVDRAAETRPLRTDPTAPPDPDRPTGGP